MKVICTNKNEAVDVSPLMGTLAWSGSVDELGVSLDFDVAFNDDRFFPKSPIGIGSRINLSGEKKDIGEFMVITEDKQGRGHIQYNAFDYAFYLNKSKETFQFEGVSSKQAIEEVCKKAGVSIKKYDLKDTTVSKIYYEKTYSEVLKDIMEIILQETGDIGHMRMEGKEIIFYSEEKEKIKPVFKLAPSLEEIEALLAISQPSKKRSIEEMKNSIKIVIAEDKSIREILVKKDDGNIEKYGMLQEVINLDKNKEAEAEKIAENKLKELNRIFEEISIEIPGDDRIRQGLWLKVEEPITGIVDDYMIWDYTSKREGASYTTTLKLKSRATIDAEKAGALADSILNKQVEEQAGFGADGSFSGMVGTTNQQKIWSFFASKGLSKQAIAGIMGNLVQEVGKSLNPATVQGGGRGPGHGLLQWEGGRLTQLKNYAKSKGRPWSDLQTQLEFAWMEMTGTGPVDKYSSTLWKRHGGFEKFKNTTNVQEATRVFEAVMERAGRPAMQNRYNYANSIYNEMKNWLPVQNINVNASGKRASILRTAESQQGKRYVWASATPSRGGFDCSGYVDYVMRTNGLKNFKGQYNTRNMPSTGDFVRISKSQLQPGDVILNHIPGGVGHAGIYHSPGKVIHSSSGRGVKITPLSHFGPMNMYLRPKGLV